MIPVCFGLSYHQARVEVRERFALHRSQHPAVLQSLCDSPGVSEAVLLSTCNRVEIYALVADGEGLVHVARFFEPELKEVEELGQPFFRLHGRPALEHLFSVASGLDSMVLGETEVLGQVKDAYRLADEAGTLGGYTHKWFQTAFASAKKIRSNTGIGRGATSVGSVAVNLAERIFGDLRPCGVMVLGAGEAAERTGRSLLSRGAQALMVSNRSFERAEMLARHMNGRAIRFEEWENYLAEVDIIIGSTSAPRPVVRAEMVRKVMQQRPARPLFLIDLAVPRDVEASVNEVEGVYVYDIDSLQTIACEGRKARESEVQEARHLLQADVQVLEGWIKARAATTPSPAAIYCVEKNRQSVAG
ncbi:MAG: glutamyl-tRNA reductase [Verrucomicrobiales bacterium]